MRDVHGVRLDSIGVLDKPTTSRPLVIYGNSMTVEPGLRCTEGLEYQRQVTDTGIATHTTSFGVGGRRTNDIAAYMINGAWSYASQGAHPFGSGATWPGHDALQAFGVIDTNVNDIGHYPDMTVAAVPTLISGAGGTRYLEGMAAAMETVLAVELSTSRVEDTSGSAVKTGTWATVATGSGGTTSFTTTPGDDIVYTVTPPQAGPYAGDVFLLSYALSPEAGTSAAFMIAVDGGAAGSPVTPPGWEQYKGFGGAQVNSVPFVTKVSLPVDGAPHTIKRTHAGSAGHFMHADAVLIPSANPLPCFVMGAPRAVKAGTVFNAAGAATWGRNWRLIDEITRDVVDEFPHSVYVPSSVTPNGLSYVDGIHPNDRGFWQRAHDLLAAMYARMGLMWGMQAYNTPDSEYETL